MPVELCWRCGAEMNWIHGTWQCGRCKLKLGCCEGEPQALGNGLGATKRLYHEEVSAGESEPQPNQARADCDPNQSTGCLEVPPHQLFTSGQESLLGR